MSQQPTLIATTRARTTFLLVTAAALALSACTGPAGAEPSASPAPVASATAIESPTPSPTPASAPTYKPASEDGPAENVPVPELPGAATEETEEGAKAFAAYWYELLGYAYESGDTQEVRSVTSSRCSRCEKALKVIDDWHTNGRWLVGGELETTGFGDEISADSDGVYQIPVQVTYGRLSYYSQGELHTSTPASSGSIDLFMAVFRDGAWSVADVGVIEAAD